MFRKIILTTLKVLEDLTFLILVYYQGKPCMCLLCINNNYQDYMYLPVLANIDKAIREYSIVSKRANVVYKHIWNVWKAWEKSTVCSKHKNKCKNI